MTAELCPSQVGKNATLWLFDGEHLSPLLSFEKDALPNYFMPGTLHLPACLPARAEATGLRCMVSA